MTKADLFWIPGPWRGRLAIAARPRGGDWLDDETRAWRRAGIHLVVSLLELGEIAQLGLGDERQAAENQGIGFISFPIPDRGVPASTAAAISAIGRIGTQLDDGRNVALHCRQSVGRSGLIATALLMNSGMKAEDAMNLVSSARGLPVPETREQRDWLEQLSFSGLVKSNTGLESVA
ncbi:MAG: dual specificity protein phosphatase family protein [Bryobacterales bacterium]|nr:dual specificity protein phosphatase family protein [Bryobacterales bacterium]